MAEIIMGHDVSGCFGTSLAPESLLMVLNPPFTSAADGSFCGRAFLKGQRIEMVRSQYSLLQILVGFKVLD